MNINVPLIAEDSLSGTNEHKQTICSKERPNPLWGHNSHKVVFWH